MRDYKDIFRSVESQNWFKCRLAVIIAREGLIEFVKGEIDKFQQDSLKTAYLVNTVRPGTKCTSCATHNVVPCPRAGFCQIQDGRCQFHTSPYRPCPNGICDILCREIEKEHRNGHPSLTNSDSKGWCVNSWELAKCFMPPDGYTNIPSIEATDFNGIINVMIDCKRFEKRMVHDLSKDVNICTKARDVGRHIQQTADLKIDNTSMKHNIATFIDLLGDEKHLKTDAKASEATTKLKKLMTDSLTITSVDIKAVLDALQDEITKSAADEPEKAINHRMSLQLREFTKRMEQLELESEKQHLDEYGRSKLPEEIILFVNTSAHGRLVLHMDPCASVKSVKEAIQDKYGYPPDKQIITYGGKEIHDNSTLANHNITANDTLRLSLRQDPGRSKLPGDITLIVITSAHGRLVLHMDPCASVKSVKEAIQDKYGYPPDKQIITYWGQEIHDNSTLADHNITANDTLRLSLRQDPGRSKLPEDITLFVNKSTGESLVLQVDPCASVYYVKGVIQDIYGYHPDKQMITYGGKEIHDNSTLADHNITANDTLRLSRRQDPGRSKLPEDFTLFVNTSAHGRLVLHMDPCASVKSVKKAIQDKYGYPPDKQILTYYGKEIMYGRTLADYNIKPVATLRLSLKQEPGRTANDSIPIIELNEALSTDNMELKTEKGTSDTQLLDQRHDTEKIHKLILDGFEPFENENLSYRLLESKMRQHIKARLEQKAIVYAAYREIQPEQIVFVVLTTKNVHKTEFKSNCGRYNIFLRNVQDCSDENGKTVDKEIDDDIGYSESDLRSINECVRKVSRDLMGAYLNVTMVTPGPCKSRNYGRGDHMIEQKVCIVISVLVKGLIPIGTRPFESTYFERPIDVREDVFDHMVLHHPREKVHPVRIGCQLESAIYYNEDGNRCVAEGSIGCLLRNEGNDLYALSCAHIFLSENELVKQKNKDEDIRQLNEERRRVYQATNENDEHFGRLEKVLYKEGNDTDDSSVGMDIALIKVNESREQTERCFPDAGRLDHLGFTEIEEMQLLQTNRGNQMVHKYGCKTLLTRGIFRGETGTKTDESGTIFFNQYIVHSKEEMTFAEEGDSGALVFRAMNVPGKETGRLEVLGILLGKGTNRNKKIYVTPIENILTAIGDVNRNHFEFYTEV